jgi:hypothetical protein
MLRHRVMGLRLYTDAKLILNRDRDRDRDLELDLALDLEQALDHVLHWYVIRLNKPTCYCHC